MTDGSGSADARSSADPVRARVRETLAVVLQRPIGADDPVLREDNPDWDSLKHIELVFALEGELGVRFEAEELGELLDVESIASAAERHGAA
jgi:acyl carrier protein